MGKVDLGCRGGWWGGRLGDPVIQYNPGMQCGLVESLCLNSFSMFQKKKKTVKKKKKSKPQNCNVSHMCGPLVEAACPVDSGDTGDRLNGPSSTK